MTIRRRLPQDLLWFGFLLFPPLLIGQTVGASDGATAGQAPFPCGDTALTRWLPDTSLEETDPAASLHRSDTRARSLYDHRLARTYAPILRFAPSERYFPTIPFWTAFLAKPGRVAPLSIDSTRDPELIEAEVPAQPLGFEWKPGWTKWKLPSISTVRESYDSALIRSVRPYRLKPPLPVVFYRVCDLIAPKPDSAWAWRAGEKPKWEPEALWHYLRSDEQAWQRFDLDGTRAGWPDTLVRDIKRFHVIQYFVYYLQDWGLLGHSEDIEYAFVFVPVDTLQAKNFRVIVGAGHDPPAPNNVLVMVGNDAANERQLHPNILVELGGHSSAPDMPPFGQFSAGLDVNWNIGDIWGTRDAQATAGLSFSGRYEGAMTYPRDPEDAVTLLPKGLGASTDSSRTMLADLVRVSPDYLAERAHKAYHEVSHKKDPPSAERRELGDSILAAYESILRSQEAEKIEAIATSTQRENVQEAFQMAVQADAAKPQYATLEQAIQADSAKSDTTLRALRTSGISMLADSVDSLVRRATCRRPGQSRVRAQQQEQCPYWPKDSIELVTDLLTRRTRRVPSDVLMENLLKLLPEPDTTGQPIDAITTEIKHVVTERLLPEYSLIPVRYLHGMYQGAQQRDTAMVERYLKLVTRLLHPVTCNELACGLELLEGDAFDLAFDATVCGQRSEQPRIVGGVYWDSSLACTFQPTLVDSFRLWNNDVYDTRKGGFGKSKRWPAKKHKIWEHALYRSPGQIFRTFLFRPTLLQVKRSQDGRLDLVRPGVTWMAGRASLPYLGIIVPAFRSVGLPFKIPGYLEVQPGLYFRWPHGHGKPTGAVGLLYDRQFAYFYGLYLKALWVNRRADIDEDPDASEFTWSFGATIWAPPTRIFRLRTGIRFDTSDLKPVLNRSHWEIQLEAQVR